jgi:pimeloyl-ACP methyl ester carboxylesterase
MIFSHGVSLFSSVWECLMEMFESRGYRVLSYDFYGHGFSSIPHERFTVGLFTEQLEDLLRELRLLEDGSTAIVVGHSMGAVVSCEFAVRNPMAVDRVVLMSSAGLTVSGSFENPMPAFVHALLYVIRNTRLADSVIWALERLLDYEARFYRLSFDEIRQVTAAMDESPRSQHKALEAAADIERKQQQQQQPPQSSSPPSLSSVALAIPYVSYRVATAPFRSLSRRLWKRWIVPARNKLVSPTVRRLVRSLNFLHKLWLYQSK